MPFAQAAAAHSPTAALLHRHVSGMPPKAAFHIKIHELQVSTSKEPAKERLTGRALLVREGVAGTTPYWECFLIDDDTPDNVLLVDAWGTKQITRAKAVWKEGCVYDVTNYLVVQKRNATAFGNNKCKISMTDKIQIDLVKGEHADIPTALPVTNLGAVLQLKAPMIVSLVLRVHKAGAQKQVTVKRTGKATQCTNVEMKAEGKTLEVTAWNRHAALFNGISGDYRLDAINVTPDAAGGGVKASTLNCSRIRAATSEESATLAAMLASDDQLDRLTKEYPRKGSRESRMLAKADITNLEMLALSVAADFDPSIASVADTFDKSYEIPSVMITGVRGIDDSTEIQDFTYRGCPKCNFKKMPADAACDKCGGTESVDRHLLYATMVDPTGSVEATAYHDAASELVQDTDVFVKPLVVLVQLVPDRRNEGKHALEMVGCKPMFTADGVLNVFRAPPARFHSYTDKVMPAVPSDVARNVMSQTTVHDVFCTYVRLLVKVVSDQPKTERYPDVDGLRCEVKCVCCITEQPVTLTIAGAFEAVHPLFSLRKKAVVHVMCVPTPTPSSDGIEFYRAEKVHCIDDEDTQSVIKAFKFETEQVKAHYGHEVEDAAADTPEFKKRAAQNHMHRSPGWDSPPRRLKLQKTMDAETAGVDRA